MYSDEGLGCAIWALLIALAACVLLLLFTTQPMAQTGPFPDFMPHKPGVAVASLPRVSARGDCRVSGKTRGLHPVLMGRLCAMSRQLGPVNVVSGCRRHGSRRAPRSYHRIAVGCKAADVTIAGVGGRTILAHWARGGGGRGHYRGRRFVHVDVGPTRAWNW